MSNPVVEYEMGYEVAEFARVLSGPFSGEKSVYRCESVAPNHWRISQLAESFLLDINISEMPKRKLGPLIELPVLKVQFQFQQKDQLQKQFFERFHQYFHKGGG